MSSPAFKNFVRAKGLRTGEVRNVSDTAQFAEGGDSLFLNTASWPELPKSQTAHNNRKASNETEKKLVYDERRHERACKQSSTSVKSPKYFSDNSTVESKQMKEMVVNLAALHSLETCTENAAALCDNGSKGKNQHFPEGIAQLSSDSHQIAATTIENNNLPRYASSDGRRRKQAQKRSELKEEKRRKREAEILRKRIEPKGQSVKVISHKVLEMVLKSDSHSISVNSQQKCDFAGLNFPTLEEATKRTKNKPLKEHISSSAGNSENCTSENIPLASTATSKKNKHKKPLEIDIHNLIKDSSRKSSEKDCRSSKGHSHLKTKQTVRYIGNQLDSSNPERKRGKKRERPKKKRYTSLKTAILEARAIRKHLRELQEQSMNAADFPEVKFCNKEPSESDKTDGQHTQTLYSEKLESNEETVKCGEDLKESVKENLNQKISCTTAAKIEAGLLQDISKLRLTPNVHSCQSAFNLQQSESLNNSFSKAACKESDKLCNESKEDNKHLLEQLQLGVQKFPQHSRKFREYCDHILTKDLNNAVKSLIENIVKFQDRLYQRDPIKAFAKRRYVVGFREVKKYLQLKRLKLIIIAPDLEVAKTKGGTDDAVTELKDMSNLQCVPYVFALNRRTLGYVTFKKVGVSCIGVFNYEGAENNFTAITEALSVARMQYNKLANNETAVSSEKEEPEETKDKVEISACIAASLLAKLREKSPEDEAQCSHKSSPFLAAIDRVIQSEDDIDMIMKSFLEENFIQQSFSSKRGFVALILEVSMASVDIHILGFQVGVNRPTMHLSTEEAYDKMCETLAKSHCIMRPSP